MVRLSAINIIVATKTNLELTEESEDGSTSKLLENLKGVMRDIAQELTCPLSLELMVDPVTAEDGHYYERVWI